MRTKYLLAIAIFVGGLSGWLGAQRQAASQSDVRRPTAMPPVDADREADDRENFQIHAGWQPLFNGRDLSGWYTFLQKHGRDSDPDRLIAIDDGVIHLYRDAANGSEVVQGYIATEKPYGNYHLRLQYRWGEKKFQPRAALPRDAGLYYHLIGDDAVWPMGLQYQIQEDNTGDLLALFGLQADSWIDPKTKDAEIHTFQDAKLGGEPVVFGGSGIAYQTRGIMNELSGWNTLEVIAKGTSVTHILNGKTVNRCENVRKVDAKDPTRSSPVSEGRIALEIEAAEIQYRNIEIKRLDADEPGKQLANATPAKQDLDVRVGASAVNLHSDGTMVIAGGIEPHYAAEQEGELRAVAVVVERPGQAKLAIVACDVLWIPRDLADAAVAEIEQRTGIPASPCAYQRHAHASCAEHGASARVWRGAGVSRRAAARHCARGRRSQRPPRGRRRSALLSPRSEDTVGSNSRQLLEDGGITWGGQQLPSRKGQANCPVRSTIAGARLRDATGKTRALRLQPLDAHDRNAIRTRRSLAKFLRLGRAGIGKRVRRRGEFSGRRIRFHAQRSSDRAGA